MGAGLQEYGQASDDLGWVLPSFSGGVELRASVPACLSAGKGPAGLHTGSLLALGCK